jgi:hypothetical protein
MQLCRDKVLRDEDILYDGSHVPAGGINIHKDGILYSSSVTGSVDSIAASSSVCSLSGDPHYRSFDKLRFDYQGTCKYNLASPVNPNDTLPYFQVFARNENRNGNTKVAYSRYVEVIYGGDNVHLAISDSITTVVPVNILVSISLYFHFCFHT